MGFSKKDDFVPDRRMKDGDQLQATEFRLTAVHTPGHSRDHLCFLLEEERTLLSGDHIIEGSTVVVQPPDGDMAAYMDSLEKVRSLRLRAIAPGHGHFIENPREVIDHYITHRAAREKAIYEAVQRLGSATVGDIVREVYRDVPESMHEWAAMNVWAHLLKLRAEGLVSGRSVQGRWRAVS